MRLSRRNTRHLICLTSLLAFASMPLLAQTGIDLLDPEQVLRAGDRSRSDEAVTVRAVLAENPTGIGQASHRETIQYDDGEFENFEENSRDQPYETGNHNVEWAQRFVVKADGTVHSARVCFLRPEGDPSRALDFSLRFYEDVTNASKVNYPGRRSGLRYSIEADIRRAGDDRCVLLRGHLVGKPLKKGAHWVGIEWDLETLKRLAGDHYTADDPADTDREKNAIHVTEVRNRELPVPEGAVNDNWRDPRGGNRTLTTSGLKAIGVSLVLETTHAQPDPEPDPDPDPEPPPDEDDVLPGPLPLPPTGPGYTDCRPTVSRLVFDGDYRVSLCYETASGARGEARAGIYKSTESGLLWFFNSNNAEVLVKVLDGCRNNGYRWVYMAAATDVAFNVYVTDGKSQYWQYNNRQGEAAVTQTETKALACSP